MGIGEELGQEQGGAVVHTPSDSAEHALSLGEQLHRLTDSMWDGSNLSEVADVIVQGIKSPDLNHQILARQTLEFLLMMGDTAVELAKSVQANQGE